MFVEETKLIIHTDGGSRGNPGPAACAFEARFNGKSIGEGSLFLGNKTNNIAEYEGVILALNWFSKNKYKKSISQVVFVLDSELVVRQLTGVYKIKNIELQERASKIKMMIEDLKLDVAFKNVPREKNKVADKLLNEELDRDFSG